jgi:REP-associated tyrosine transposase
MPNYRRLYVPGGTYFFTLVTANRRRILCHHRSREILRDAIERVARMRPFEIVAWVLLPDHLHAIWTLPNKDDDFSTRWQKIKDRFTRVYLAQGGVESRTSPSRLRHGERAIWQRRFWEHSCRDDDDLKRCLDYVHWNPVKHGLVKNVRDYPWSTFHRYVRLREYPVEWGSSDPYSDFKGAEWDD